MIDTTEKLTKLNNIFFENLAPPPELQIWEWADKYRVLSSEASSEPGKWRTSRFPFTKEIMAVLSPQDPTEEVVFMKGAQIAGTEVLLNFMGYGIDYDPAPMLYIQKTVDSVMRFSAQRFTKSLENTPRVAAKLPTQKSRDDSNTKLLKNFPGGIIIMGGANSAASLRSMPICKLLLDELDSFEADIQSEGDPIELAIRRTANFPRRKIVYISTPLVQETSKIEPLFKDGDQRYYNVPCPFCEHEQTLKWGNIVYENDDPKTVKLKCEKCGELIDERYKTQMLDRGRWIKTHPGREIASFHLNSLYSPLGFFSWQAAVKLWLKYKRTRNTEVLRVFINTVLGETYSEAGKAIDFDTLNTRKEKYKAEVPKDVMLLTCGVDVQETRIEAEIVGWGDEQESWSIDYVRLMGDTEYDGIWKQLEDYLARGWLHTSGLKLTPACTAIDSGHRAKIVYNFCAKWAQNLVFPIKGRDGWGQGLIHRPTKPNQHGVYLFNAFVDELKSKIYSQFKLDTVGPGYCHFPNKSIYDQEYFMMITAEKLIRKRVAGKYKMAWSLPAGKRNEALDCRAYAISALNILKPNFEAIKKRGIPLNAENNKIKVRKRRVLSTGVEV